MSGDLTTARVGLGRSGVSLPTSVQLAMAADHARARDAVHAQFDVAGLQHALREVGCVVAATRAADRGTYLRRPDLGRVLADSSRAELAALPACDLAVLVSDGLSATAANRHAAPLVTELCRLLPGLRVSVVVVPLARVGLLNDAGAALRARAAAIILGERPGLSAPDSLSFYFEVAPRDGLTDADRNCVSNIRPDGLPVATAAAQAAALIEAGLVAGLSGTLLKVELQDHRPLTG